MGKYSCNVDGKVLDWKFVRPDYNIWGEKTVWNFYLGETYIGQLYKMKWGGWGTSLIHSSCPFGGLDGFASRYRAAEYMLKVCGFIRHPDQVYNERMKDQGYMHIKLEEYLELTGLKDKLKAAEEKVKKLESLLSWANNPERMGN